jgi:hypothetical protein
LFVIHFSFDCLSRSRLLCSKHLKAMASSTSAQAVENIIGYRVRSKHDFLPKVLTAAGAVEEDWDGNRKLAMLGTALSEFLLHYLAFEAGITRGELQCMCDTEGG